MTEARAPKPATDRTRAAMAEFEARLAPVDPEDLARATRGLLATLQGPIVGDNGAVAWDSERWAFTAGDTATPASVNPSLWRQARLNAQHGLFEVVDGVYQVRGYDVSNVTFVRGDRGWIVIDPLTTTATARAAYGLVSAQLGHRPVSAVIYTHSHVDHYGGVLGVVSLDDVRSGAVPVIAPAGFLDAAVSENVIAGPAMGRRAMYMFGALLPPGVHGHVDTGLGKAIATGDGALVAPTVEIDHTGAELVVDGVRIVFQLTPETEAPAEMHFAFPDLRVLCLAENCNATMHNVLTPRGAVVRDARRWSRYLDEALRLFGDTTDTLVTSHNWPVWGADQVRGYVRRQRDLYRWLHDEAMRLANLGFTPLEIAAQVELPPGLWQHHHCHGFYGTVSHNVRAVYQRYLGFFDGNPARLDPLPPAEAGRRYVEFMGGADAVVARARESYEAGDYRWVAQVLDHVVFAEPDHEPARLLAADALEQLGYQAESGPWRDFYLTGAQELRHGPPAAHVPVRPRANVVGAMTLEQVFDYLAVRLDGVAAAALGHHLLQFELPDTGQTVAVELSNGTLHGTPGVRLPVVEATVHCPRAVLDQLLVSGAPVGEALADGRIAVDGDASILEALWACLVEFPLFFPIVTP